MSTDEKSAIPSAGDNLPKKDSLGSWLHDVEEMGDLMVISAEVDPNLQMSTVAYMSGQEVGSPVLMFDNIKGHPGGRAVYNLANSSLRRSALTIREDVESNGTQLVSALKDKMKIKLGPKTVDADSAVVNQNIEVGEDIDIRKFPAPQMWPLDGGRYIGTGDAVITKDPETGRVNVGCYRQMIKSRNEVGYYASPGKDTLLDREKWWAMGKPAPVAAAYGLDPLLFMCASTSFPKDSSEYDFYGGIAGEPLEV
ncbi:MAG: UbiD family decarboxylase, partial [Rhodospirillales bacterium]|nr:UbiD family decarboxylase [Rhodospirillales bacterium]